MTMWCHQLQRDFVMLEGPDAATYLQSQVSQDLRGLGVGEARCTFVLQPTGKVDVLCRVLRSGDAAFLLDVDAGWGAALTARLQRFKIRVKAELSPVAWACVAVRGEGELPAVPGAVAVPAWPGAPGVDLLGPALDAAAIGLPVADAATYERARIEAGWPAMGSELDADTIPGSTGVLGAAVSFTKGCYPGQELVERIDSRGGNVPRHLRVLRAVSGADLVIGAPIMVDGKEVGSVTSAVSDVALGYVGRAVEVPADAVAGDVAVHVLAIAAG
jgi:tRNA-modifying protein YgfZ